MLGEHDDDGGTTPEADRFADAQAPVRSRFGRRRRLAILVALVLLALLLALWFVRRPVAENFIDQELTRRGVPASYRITDFGLGRQRLTDVVIGDPRNPDLVADWMETETGVGFSGPYLNGIRAGHVRLRGRIVDGRVSLGAIDRLLPAPSGKPFALPGLEADIADLRMRLETPAGLVALKIAGSGRLDNGFDGRIAAVAPTLAAGGCTATAASALVHARIDRGRPLLTGPIRAAALRCTGIDGRALAASVDIELGTALTRWMGSARVASDAVRSGYGDVARLRGIIRFAGDAAKTGGTLDVEARGVGSRWGAANAMAMRGAYRIGPAMAFDGTIGLTRGAVAPGLLASAGSVERMAPGTPIAPILSQIARAGTTAARDLSGEAVVSVREVGGRGAARLSRLALESASGASIAMAGGNGIAFGWPTGGVRVDSDVTVAGGGLPQMRVTLAQSAAGAPIRGTATVQPYGAGAARIALAPVVFSTAGGGATRIATVATLSGPLGDGRVEAARLPLTAVLDRGRLILNPGCAPLSVERLAASGLTLGRSGLTLCPVDGALVRWEGGRLVGRLGGGMRIGASRLSGSLGATPLTLAVAGAEYRLADGRFHASDVAVRLGSPGRLTRLDVARLSGSMADGTAGGRFDGAAGQIGNVPLLLSAAGGDWRWTGGDLSLQGGLSVADAQTDAPRFQPLAGKDVTLTMIRGTIAAKGTLVEPSKAVKIADVAIQHVLSSGSGAANLSVPGIAFTPDFQPELLTRLTFGVIADVRGTVTGEGHIAWNPDGVTSDGVFRTGDTDLAAAFGPVTGISTEIRFTDLLALESAAGQVATVRTINPGVPVTDGRIVYQTYPNSRILVNSGQWPFAGGTLTLDPTLLDFSQPSERRMTFHVAGVKADQFLQQFDFDNLDATGTFDGVLPMIFDTSGGRIEGGDLTVREGGGTIAYVGDLSQKDLGFWGNLAFQALKSLRYRNLSIGMNGPLAGEMITSVRFAGVHQGEGAKSNFLIRRLQRLPFVFNIRIKAPFRGLLDSAQSFYDPKRLIQRNLPTLLDQQNKRSVPPVQPPASEKRP